MARFNKLEFEADRSEPTESISKKKSKLEELTWLEQAVEQRSNGQYENALRLYSRALEDDKSLVTAWVGQVQMLVMLDESVEAELWSRKALELFPGNGDLMAGRAQASRRSGNKTVAISLSDGSLRAAGQSAYRWMVRGELMAATKQPTERHCFDKAAQVDPSWLTPLEIALIYLELGIPSRGLEWVRRAVQTEPGRYYGWIVKGRIEEELGFAGDAEKSFEHCLQLCPGHAEAEDRLAKIDQGGGMVKRFWRRLFGS